MPPNNVVNADKFGRHANVAAAISSSPAQTASFQAAKGAAGPETSQKSAKGELASHAAQQAASAAQLTGKVVSSPTKTLRLQRLLQTAIYGGVYVASVEAERGSQEPVDPRQKRRVALKVMSLELNKQNRETLQEDAFSELRFHSQMKGHRNVLVYEEVFQDNELLYVVLPYAEFEDLFEILKKRPRPFDEGECRWLFWQLLHGADFLHSRGIAFRDHSLENVLMFHQKDDGTIYPKITDPGQAVLLQYNADGSLKKLVHDKTFGKSFRPPEVYSGLPYDPIKVDVFCLGWMLFYCLTKNQPFDKTQETDKNWALLKAGRYSDLLQARGGTHLSSYARDLLFKMLAPNPAQRLSVKQAINHPWLRNGAHVQIDDRTVYGLTHTAERLGPHPRQLQKMRLELLRKEQQAAAARSVTSSSSASSSSSRAGEFSPSSASEIANAAHGDALVRTESISTTCRISTCGAEDGAGIALENTPSSNRVPNVNSSTRRDLPIGGKGSPARQVSREFSAASRTTAYSPHYHAQLIPGIPSSQGVTTRSRKQGPTLRDKVEAGSNGSPLLAPGAAPPVVLS